MKIVFLHREISGYFLACARKLSELHNAEVHIFRYPVNKEAPFNFPEIKNLYYHERNNYDFDKLQKKLSEITPSLIYIAGWNDKDYLKICREWKEKVPVVMALDNQWKGSLKQKAATAILPYKLQKSVSHIWCAGLPQVEYAKRLGYDEKHILLGMYSADVDNFRNQYFQWKELKEKIFPKVILFVGRYVKDKGIEELWNAFAKIQNKSPNSWELWCAGTGELGKKFPINKKIKNLGFVQPENLFQIVKEAGVFILPSRFEPWGVALHEFAAAGFPLICSSQVGAATQFLKEGENGFLFEANNEQSLSDGLLKMMNSSDKQLQGMSEKSVEISQSNTPEKWANTFVSVLHKK